MLPAHAKVEMPNASRLQNGNAKCHPASKWKCQMLKCWELWPDSWIIAATGSHTANPAVLRYPQGAHPASDPGGLVWATTKANAPMCAMLPAPRPAFNLRVNSQNSIYLGSGFRTAATLEHATQVTRRPTFSNAGYTPPQLPPLPLHDGRRHQRLRPSRRAGGDRNFIFLCKA